MNSDEKKYLKNFYDVLKDNTRRERTLKENSLLITFLESRSGNRFRLLKKSVISSSSIPRNILTELSSNDFIQLLSGLHDYVITAKGVWETENDLGLINNEKFFSYINNKYFTGKAPGSHVKSVLDEREKIILFAMILTRTFSEQSTADLNRNEQVQNIWKEILEKSYDLLDELGQIKKLNKDSFFSTKGNEHIASNIFRHNNKIVQKTKGFYVAKGNYNYFLNIYDDSTFSTEKLSYLFWKIFKGNLSTTSIDKIIEACKEISKKESIYIFNIRTHMFSMPIYDSLIKDSLLDSITSKNEWEKIH